MTAPQQPQRSSATVQAINPTAGTVDVAMNGGTATGLQYPAWYVPVIGDSVIVDWLGSQPYVAEAFNGAILGAGSVFRSGAYYGSPGTGSATCAPGVGSCTAVPFGVGKPTWFDQLGIEVTTAAATGGVIRLGIYADTGQGFPGLLWLDAGLVPSTAAGFVTVTILQLLPAGLYWLAAQPEVASGALRSVTNTPPGMWGMPATAGGGVFDGFIATGVPAGALPAWFPVPSTLPYSNVAKVFIHAA
jgi:hypothetical protein